MSGEDRPRSGGSNARLSFKDTLAVIWLSFPTTRLVTFNSHTLKSDEKFAELEQIVNKLRSDILIGLSKVLLCVLSYNLFYHQDGRLFQDGVVGFAESVSSGDPQNPPSTRSISVHPPSIRQVSPGNTQVTPPGLRVSMGGGELFDSSHTRLSLEYAMKKDIIRNYSRYEVDFESYTYETNYQYRGITRKVRHLPSRK
ncbi:hypothetical protein EVAR_27177_1 [Eumeta japonica]|uniref:Uncharacterized protein n=1 Tax=Eumeta variegata TaxID=151549 RepID=A0A4C1VYA0_EUMVA|nr:hypothetical protein EVAR_27177_1 [Eumeta japonica]